MSLKSVQIGADFTYFLGDTKEGLFSGSRHFRSSSGKQFLVERRFCQGPSDPRTGRLSVRANIPPDFLIIIFSFLYSLLEDEMIKYGCYSQNTPFGFLSMPFASWVEVHSLGFLLLSLGTCLFCLRTSVRSYTILLLAVV